MLVRNPDSRGRSRLSHTLHSYVDGTEVVNESLLDPDVCKPSPWMSQGLEVGKTDDHPARGGRSIDPRNLHPRFRPIVDVYKVLVPRMEHSYYLLVLRARKERAFHYVAGGTGSRPVRDLYGVMISYTDIPKDLYSIVMNR